MVEVFKTNVKESYQATSLISQIHQIFWGYVASFDLEDCDKILRIQSATDRVKASDIILILQNSGFNAEVLPD